MRLGGDRVGAEAENSQSSHVIRRLSGYGEGRARRLGWGFEIYYKYL